MYSQCTNQRKQTDAIIRHTNVVELEIEKASLVGVFLGRFDLPYRSHVRSNENNKNFKIRQTV